MKYLEFYIVPYIISQVLAWAILIISWNHTRTGRILFAVLFTWASITNLVMAMSRPGVYVDYAPMAVPIYSNFIQGWFRLHIGLVVPLIAFGQLLIAAGMILKNGWVTAACAGAIIFLVSIAPLGVGSGFPCTLILAVAAARIWKKDAKRFIWKKASFPLSGVRSSRTGSQSEETYIGTEPASRHD